MSQDYIDFPGWQVLITLVLLFTKTISYKDRRLLATQWNSHFYYMDLKNLKTGDTATETVDVTVDLSDEVFVLLQSI